MLISKILNIWKLNKQEWGTILTMNDVAIVYSDYYKDISDGLIKGIEANLDPKFSIHKFNVKGSWEIIYKINELIDFLKENYASDFQYNFNIGDFPTLDNANVGSAYSSYDAWVGAFIEYFPEFRLFATSN